MKKLPPSRLVFLLTVAYAGGIFWLAPHPPMVDLPQHAGQIMLLHDLLLGQSAWQNLVQINWFTPYLVGYGLALPLSFVMPVVTALKLLLTLAYYAFVYSCVLLRRRFGGDERLDWLFVPGFFGFAYAWGFFTFLIAAPLGLLFILVADRYAEHPGIRNGIRMGFAALLLFFCHGLIFLFACGIACAQIALKNRNPLRFPVALLPFVPLVALSAVYALVSHSREDSIPHPISSDISWNWGWDRLRFFVQVFGASKDDWLFNICATVAGAFMLLAPILLESATNRRTSSAFVPMAAIVLLWLLLPSYAMRTGYLYERFAMFILPFYALMFCRHETATDQIEQETARGRACGVLLASLCWAFLGVQTYRALAFRQESEDFETVRAAVEPSKRALSLAFDIDSVAVGNPWAYVHYALWYQAENQGFVDFNFAWNPPPIVRFRKDQFPRVGSGFEWNPQAFRWGRYQGRRYRYFFVRRIAPLPTGFFDNDQCDVSLLKSAGSWSVYESTRCR